MCIYLFLKNVFCFQGFNTKNMHNAENEPKMSVIWFLWHRTQEEDTQLSLIELEPQSTLRSRLSQERVPRAQ